MKGIPINKIDPYGGCQEDPAYSSPPTEGFCVCGGPRYEHGHDAIKRIVMSSSWRSYHPAVQEKYLDRFIRHMEACADGEDCTAFPFDGGCGEYSDSLDAATPDPDAGRD
jgi:hypothetical protein